MEEQHAAHIAPLGGHHRSVVIRAAGALIYFTY